MRYSITCAVVIALIVMCLLFTHAIQGGGSATHPARSVRLEAQADEVLLRDSFDRADSPQLGVPWLEAGEVSAEFTTAAGYHVGPAHAEVTREALSFSYANHSQKPQFPFSSVNGRPVVYAPLTRGVIARPSVFSLTFEPHPDNRIAHETGLMSAVGGFREVADASGVANRTPVDGFGVAFGRSSTIINNSQVSIIKYEGGVRTILAERLLGLQFASGKTYSISLTVAPDFSATVMVSDGVNVEQLASPATAVSFPLDQFFIADVEGGLSSDTRGAGVYSLRFDDVTVRELSPAPTPTPAQTCFVLTTNVGPTGGGTVSNNVEPNCSTGSPSAYRQENSLSRGPSVSATNITSKVPHLAKPEERFRKLLEKAAGGKSLHVIVGLNISVKPEGALGAPQQVRSQRADIAQAQGRVLRELSSARVASVKKFPYIPFMALETDAAGLMRLKASASVRGVSEDRPAPPSTSESVSLIGAPVAWSAGYSGAGQTIAILDTGVDKSHPFLADKVVSEACYSTNGATSSSLCPGGVEATTTAGSGVNCPPSDSRCGHGTHVAGIAAGRSNGAGSGVARDANLIAIQVFSRVNNQTECGESPTPCLGAYPSDYIMGLQRVLTLSEQYDIAAVNLSLGIGRHAQHCDTFDETTASIKAAIDNLHSRGIATVASAGNDRYGDGLHMPACISSAVSVGSTDDGSSHCEPWDGCFPTQADAVSLFRGGGGSNVASHLDLFAPGSWVYSSIPTGFDPNVPGPSFENKQGTSMAAPHVAGAWAVLKSRFPSATVPQILEALKKNGVPIRLNALNIDVPRIRLDAALNALAAGLYSSGTGVTLTAVPAPGYVFQNWSGCDSTSGVNCSVTMSTDRAVTANFATGAPTPTPTPGPITLIHADDVTVFSASTGPNPCSCPGSPMSPSSVSYHVSRSFFISGLKVDNDDFSGNNHSGFGNVRALIFDVNDNLIASSTNTLYGESGQHDFTFRFEGQLVPPDFKLTLILTDGIQGLGNFTVRNLRFYEDITPALNQLSQSDAITGKAIPEGAQTVENPVALGGVVRGFPHQVKLQVELRPLSQAFTNTANLESALAPSGSFISVTPHSLADDRYHWQARAVDSQGYVSPWQEFGSSGNADFVLKTTPTFPQVYADTITVFSAENGSAGGCCPNFVMSPSPVSYHLPGSFLITGLTVDNDDFSGNNRAGFGNIRAFISDVNDNVIASSTNTLWGQFGLHDFTFAFDGQLIPQDFKLSFIGVDVLQGGARFTVRNIRFAGNPPTPCAPVFNSQPSSKTVLEGQSATLTADVRGSGLSYQWYSGAGGDTTSPISGATGSSYTTSAQPGRNRKQYWVRARNNCGSADSAAAAVVTTDKRPLIFIPGIAGSVLSGGDGEELWLGNALRFGRCGYGELSLAPGAARGDITATDAIRSDPATRPVYETLIDRLTSDEVGYHANDGQTLFIFAYDWRRSNSEAAGALDDLITRIQEQYPSMPVDIVAHSMGGLVAQRYIFDRQTAGQAHRVHKVITIGTPWLGAPKAINVLETGQFLDPLGLYHCTGTIKALAWHFKGMHELLPSETFFRQSTGIGFPAPFKEDGWDVDGDGNATEDYDYGNLKLMLDSRYQNSQAGTTNQTFHSKPGQDDGSGAPADIRYYHFYGNKTQASTVGQVIAKRGLNCAFTVADGILCRYSYYFDLVMTHGDDTVPLVSATRLGRWPLNEPDHELVPFSNRDDRTAKVGHVELVKNPAVLAKMLEALNETGPAAPRGPDGAEAEEEQTTPSYYLKVLGAPSVTIADAFGNSAALTSASLGAEVPGVTSFILGEQGFMTVMPTDRYYTLTFRSNGEPVSVTLTRGTDTDTTGALRYIDLTLPANVTARLEITPQGGVELRYDADGDGTYEVMVTPTAAASGAAAQDMDAPSVVVGAVIHGSGDLVTVNSSDSGSGVKATYYSLDGTTFQAYGSPFVVDPRKSPTVYAFADDNVANRSGLVSLSLPIPEPTPIPTPGPSSLSNVSGGGVFNGMATLTATLASGGSPLSGKTVSFTLNGASAGNATTDTGGVATLTGISVAGVNVGAYADAVGASFSGDANFTGASSTGALAIGKAAQTIAFSALPDKTFGDLDFNIGATASSGLPVSFSGTGNCIVTGSSIHLTGAGPCTVKASQAGNSNYNAAADVSRSFNTNKSHQTITFSALTNKTYGGPDFPVSATASSGLGVNFAAAGQCAASGSTIRITGAGACTVTASQPGNANYNAAPDASQGVTIAKAGTTTTVTVSNAVYDSQPHGATAMVTGAVGLSQNLSVTYVGRNATVYGPSTAAPTNAGDYTASADFTGDSNHSSSSGSKDFNISRAVQTIAFGSLVDKTFGDADFPIGATASSGLAVNFLVAGQCSITGSNVHLTGAGSCTITASQGGNTNFNAAADVQRAFQIGKASQTIIFGALANKTVGDPDFTVSATTSSGLSASFSAGGDCTASGNSIHITGAGSCTVTASQAGDANHTAAADVSQSFQIARATATADVSSSVNPSAFNQGVTFTATITSAAGTPAGSVQFKADGDSMGGPINCEAGANNSCVARLTTSALAAGAHAIAAEYSGDANFGACSGALAGGQAVGGAFDFSQPSYTASERDGSIIIAVRRAGDTSRAMSVNYFTDDGSGQSIPAACPVADGIARERCDYTRAAGALEFAAGESERFFSVLVNEDSYVEGTETTHLRLEAPGLDASLGIQSSATLQIMDAARASVENPIGDSGFFVRQHYHDFLNREPDASGLQFWMNEIESCGSNMQCREVKRTNVSAAFFLSIEFQETGYLIHRAYKAAYGDANSPNVLGTAPVVRLQEFLPDTRRIGQDVVVGQGAWEQQLEANKTAYMAEFVQRPRFLAAFPLSMPPAQFVDRLNQNTGSVLTQSERDQLVAQLASSADVTAGRAGALRSVAENKVLHRNELNRAFVLMQFYGYLRRNPDDPQDTDFSGWRFWLDKLDQFGGDFVQAEMVKAFLSADEYRNRFGH